MAKWKKIDEVPNYEVSTEGSVKNIKNGKILKPYLGTCKYEVVNL